ncbi:MAG: hypothetical protein IKS68_00340, partial [Mailhella sp.]|nr:hypothetical protein [Mailhella sp.]
LPTDCVLYSGENAELVHNTWPALWAKLNREAVEESGKLCFRRGGKEIFACSVEDLAASFKATLDW